MKTYHGEDMVGDPEGDGRREPEPKFKPGDRVSGLAGRLGTVVDPDEAKFLDPAYDVKRYRELCESYVFYGGNAYLVLPDVPDHGSCWKPYWVYRECVLTKIVEAPSVPAITPPSPPRRFHCGAEQMTTTITGPVGTLWQQTRNIWHGATSANKLPGHCTCGLASCMHPRERRKTHT